MLAIIGLMMTAGLPAIQVISSQRINSTTRRFIGVVRSIRNDAILLNLVHRLVLNFEDQTWWVESQQSFALLETPNEDDKEGNVDSNFTYAQKYSKNPMKLPSGVALFALRTEREGLLNKGVAYVHFFPNGFADQAILQLSREGAEIPYYSLVIRPTAGRVELVSGDVEGF